MEPPLDAPRHIVGVTRCPGAYPSRAPYHPDVAFPEYGEGPRSEGPNPVYAGVRETLRRLGLDRERYGTRDWNPLGEIVRPGDRVFIKPNLVTHEYRRSCGLSGDVFSVITHPSVVRAIADYTALALKGRGQIVIGDNPCIDADFDRLMSSTGLPDVAATCQALFAVSCRVVDLRPRWTPDLQFYGYRSRTAALAGDPEGETVMDLGPQSFLHGLSPVWFHGVFRSRLETVRNHAFGRHRYAFSNTILNSDVYISLPKLKAHHKVGATLNVKGLVGTASNKNLLVHWRQGFPATGGDEYPTPHRRHDPARLVVTHLVGAALPESVAIAARGLLPRWLTRWFRHEVRHDFERYRGAWEGNDTCWRMAADLYVAFIRDATGWRTARGKRLRTFSCVDGIVGGEGNGPFCPTPKASGVLIAGADLLAVDAVSAHFMGYDIRRIRYLPALLARERRSLSDIDVVSREYDTDDFFAAERTYGGFAAPDGWPRLSRAAPREQTQCA